MENSRSGTIFSVLIAAAVCFAAFYYMENRPRAFNELGPEAGFPADPDLEEKFEDFLNGFIRQVDEAMKTYKIERKILIQVFRAENMRQPSYVEENYKMVEEQLVPSLREKMAAIVKNFEDAEQKIDELLVNQPDDARAEILEAWGRVKTTHVQAYINFFSYENQIIAAYHDLINFYYTKRNEFEADLENNAFVFKNPADAEEEKNLKQKISDLYAQQSAALKQD